MTTSFKQKFNELRKIENRRRELPGGGLYVVQITSRQPNDKDCQS